MTVSVRRSDGATLRDATAPESDNRRSLPPARSPDLHRIPDAPHYVAALARVATESTEGERQARLDAFRDSFSGPYVIDGQPAIARPMFRMNGGANDRSQQAHAAELRSITRAANVPPRALANAMAGRPTPGELRLVTQALIDAGKLRTTSESFEVRIRQLQWEWGIGVDCAGYTEQAARAARGAAPKAPTHGDAFSGLPHDKTMQKIDVAHIRAGDVIHLAPSSGEAVGHNVVVYSRALINAAEIASANPIVTRFFTGKGPFHALEVDSSWGAGPSGADYGGFRRDTWVYDQSGSSWLYLEGGSKTYAVSDIGPHEHPYRGAFRLKTER